MRTKDINSLNQRGYTTVSIDKETKGLIREMAGDMPVSEFVREMVTEYANQKQIPMTGTGIPGVTNSQIAKAMINPTSYVRLAITLAYIGAGFTMGFMGVGQSKKNITKKQVDEIASALAKIVDDLPDQSELGIEELIAEVQPI